MQTPIIRDLSNSSNPPFRCRAAPVVLFPPARNAFRHISAAGGPLYKMEKTYGAQIPDEAKQAILRYLQSHYTLETRKP